MKEIFKEWGGTIIILIAVVAVIGLVGFLMQPNGVIDGAFTTLVQSFVDKSNVSLDGAYAGNGGTGGSSEGEIQLAVPAITINGTALSITPVENATGYEVYNGEVLLAAGPNTTVDLGEFLTAAGTYNISVKAVGSGFAASEASTTTFKVSDSALNPDNGTTPQLGDVYKQGDYEYCYGYTVCDFCRGYPWSNECGCNYTCAGWAVRCVNNVAAPGPILESINGAPITNMNSTFDGCSNLTTVPKIPESVTDLSYAFNNCTSLSDVSYFVISKNVTKMDYAFQYCHSLKNLPVLSEATGLLTMKGTFSYCDALFKLGTIVIPENVTSIDSIFYNCNMFSPENVIIPESVKTMKYAFYNCANLNGTITINANPTNYQYCFAGANIVNTEFTGSSAMIDEIVKTVYSPTTG